MNGDGCSSTCTIEDGWSCGTSYTSCTNICGDGLIISSLEECDDGNEDSGDGCFICLVEEGWNCDTSEPSVCETICGDGLLKGEEECDDGNDDDSDSCSTECLPLTF